MYKQKSVLLGLICALLCSLMVFAGSGFLSTRYAFAEGETAGETVYTIKYLDSTDGATELVTTNPPTVTAENFPLTIVAPTASAGYTFAYWGFNKTASLEPDSSGNFILTEEDAQNKAKDGVVTIYAYWQLTEYKVSFEYTGVQYGAVTPAEGFEELNNIINTTMTIDLTQDEYMPKCAGHEFVGWFTDSLYQNTITTLSGVTSNIKLYGKFNQLDYTITFADESLGYDPIPFRANMDYAYDVNGQKGLLTDLNPTREGYTFAGWYTTEDCAEGSHIGKYYIFTTPVTLYAKWEKKPSMLWLYFAGGSCVLIGGGFAWWYFASRRKLTLG